MTDPETRPGRSTWPWWLFYLAAAVVGVLAGNALFTWVST